MKTKREIIEHLSRKVLESGEADTEHVFIFIVNENETRMESSTKSLGYTKAVINCAESFLKTEEDNLSRNLAESLDA